MYIVHTTPTHSRGVFSDGDSTTPQPPLITGLCLQVYDGLSVPSSDHPYQLIFGKVRANRTYFIV